MAAAVHLTVTDALPVPENQPPQRPEETARAAGTGTRLEDAAKSSRRATSLACSTTDRGSAPPLPRSHHAE